MLLESVTSSSGVGSSSGVASSSGVGSSSGDVDISVKSMPWQSSSDSGIYSKNTSVHISITTVHIF